jgi:hypothetical protein
MSVLRAEMADAAEDIATQADAFAALLEQAASRGDAARRLGLAAREREISRIERTNAVRLRSPPAGPLHLEPLPTPAEADAPATTRLRHPLRFPRARLYW